MKVMIRRTAKGVTAYVPKKDVEQPVIHIEKDELWGGQIKLKNGWTLLLPDMPADTKLPITVNARKIGGEDDE